MCRARCVLVLVTMCLGVAQSWDLAVSVKDQLMFYTNGTKIKTVNLISQNPTALVYDEVNNVMLYVDKQNNNDAVCGYYLSSKDNKCFIKRNGRDIHGLAYDPVTELIFFTDTNEKSINSISLKPGSHHNIYDNLIIKMGDETPADIAVDGCRGYIYWTNLIVNNIEGKIERAHFNGAEREVMRKSLVLIQFRLVIDPQTQKMFFFYLYQTSSGSGYLHSIDLTAKNEKILLNGVFRPRSPPKVLTVSKDYVYWSNSNNSYDFVWRLPKNTKNGVGLKKILSFHNERVLGITARYKIEDQIKGIQDCDSLSSLIPTITVTPHYTAERREGCENYCFQGNCIVNHEGLPKCSCNVGYSGKRCEVDACHGYCLNNGYCSLNESSAPVCQCDGDYSGDRCEVSHCLNYCMYGNCSLSDEGHPTCSCDAGYSGKRCEVSACHGYCLNDGDCSLNEEDQPVCQCVGNYEGSRCEAGINDSVEKDLTLADLFSTWRKPSSKSSFLLKCEIK